MTNLWRQDNSRKIPTHYIELPDGKLVVRLASSWIWVGVCGKSHGSYGSGFKTALDAQMAALAWANDYYVRNLGPSYIIDGELNDPRATQTPK